MSYPFIPQFKYRVYADATTSSSGTPIGTIVVVSRCKYVGGWFCPNNAGTSTNVTGFDVVAFLGGSATSVTISSGTSVTTTTGTLATPVNVTATSAILLNPGDLITILGSTCQGGFYSHIVQEF